MPFSYFSCNKQQIKLRVFSMKPQTPIEIAGLEGWLYLGIGTLPTLAFVPARLVSDSGSLDRNSYFTGDWAYANNYANPEASGSHVWPDMERPAPKNATGLEVFTLRLTARLQGRA